MSKQDRQGVRTATDLERKYGFGQSFAEIYNLANDARAAAEAAQDAVSDLDGNLTAEEIFNRLTGGGVEQGVYRGNDGLLYINAKYINSGKVKAEYIDADNLKVKAANITGTLTANQIDTANLKVNAANITGTLSVGCLPDGMATTDDIPSNVSELTNDSGYQNRTGVVDIINGTVTADFLNALGVSATFLQGSYIYVNNFYGSTTAVLTPGSSTGGGLDITSYGNLHLASSNSFVSMYGGNIVVSGTYMYPTGQATYLGHSSYGMWQAVYAYTSAIQTSDRNLKHSIEELPEKYVTMFDNLSPVRYKMNNGTSDRYHVGFIAQEVEDAMTVAGIDSQEFAGFVKDKDTDGNDLYMLRYEEFIGVLAAKIKELETKIEAMGA